MSFKVELEEIKSPKRLTLSVWFISKGNISVNKMGNGRITEAVRDVFRKNPERFVSNTLSFSERLLCSSNEITATILS